MSNIKKQTLFKVLIKQVHEITLLFDGNWHKTTTRIWGNQKEIIRHLFKIKDEDGLYCWFECNKDIAEEILTITKIHIKNGKNELSILLSPVREKHSYSKTKLFLNMWKQLKKLLKNNRR